jgi:hypothetical protein
MTELLPVFFKYDAAQHPSDGRDETLLTRPFLTIGAPPAKERPLAPLGSFIKT